jgi:hypothetical protein
MNFKTTAILLVLLLAVGGYLFFTRESENGPKQQEEHKLVDIARASDVEKVVINSADGKRTVLQKQGKDWRLTEPVSALADDNDVNTMVENLVSMKSNNQLDPKDAPGSKTGLDKPQYTVELTASGGKASKVQFGDKLAVGNSVYARVEGKSPVEVVPADVLDKVDRPASAFRQLKLIETPSLEIKQVAISPKDGPALKLEKTGTDWQIVEPSKVPADAGAVTDLLNALTGLRAVSFVERPAEASDAMQTTTLTVTYSTQAPSTQPASTTKASDKAAVIVTFGDYDLLKKNIYVKTSDSPFVAKVNASSVDSFTKKPLDLRDKKALDIKPEEVSRFSIATEPPPTTQPATNPATRPAVKEVVVERRKETPSGAPFVAGSSATQPSTKPSAKLTIEDKLPKKSAWTLAGAEGGEAEDSDVTSFLGALHPLRADKYVETNPATQPTKVYVVKVHTEAAGGAGAGDYDLRFSDRGQDQPYVGEYNGLTFEVSRFTLSRYLEADFKKKPGGAGGAGTSPPPSLPPGLGLQ